MTTPKEQEDIEQEDMTRLTTDFEEFRRLLGSGQVDAAKQKLHATEQGLYATRETADAFWYYVHTMRALVLRQEGKRLHSNKRRMSDIISAYVKSIREYQRALWFAKKESSYTSLVKRSIGSLKSDIRAQGWTSEVFFQAGKAACLANEPHVASIYFELSKSAGGGYDLRGHLALNYILLAAANCNLRHLTINARCFDAYQKAAVLLLNANYPVPFQVDAREPVARDYLWIQYYYTEGLTHVFFNNIDGLDSAIKSLKAVEVVNGQEMTKSKNLFVAMLSVYKSKMKRQFPQALLLFEQMRKLDQTNYFTQLSLLAEIQIGLGNFAEAEVLYLQCKAGKDFTCEEEKECALHWLRFIKGDFQGALEGFRALYQRYPRNFDIANSLLQVLVFNKQTDEAQALASVMGPLYQTLSPRGNVGYQNLAMALAALYIQQPNIEFARTAVKSGLSQLCLIGHPMADLVDAEILFSEGKYAEALDACERAKQAPTKEYMVVADKLRDDLLERLIGIAIEDTAQGLESGSREFEVLRQHHPDYTAMTIYFASATAEQAERLSAPAQKRAALNNAKRLYQEVLRKQPSDQLSAEHLRVVEERLRELQLGEKVRHREALDHEKQAVRHEVFERFQHGLSELACQWRENMNLSAAAGGKIFKAYQTMLADSNKAKEPLLLLDFTEFCIQSGEQYAGEPRRVQVFVNKAEEMLEAIIEIDPFADLGSLQQRLQTLNVRPKPRVNDAAAVRAMVERRKAELRMQRQEAPPKSGKSTSPQG